VEHTLIIGDALDGLRTLASDSFQLVVTSPPYGTIKDYGHPRQIGIGQDYAGYLERLREVWVECVRVLEPGCRIVINVGDQFLRARDHGEYSVAPIHADVITQVNALPGMVFLGQIIWRKISTTKTTGGCTWMGSIYEPRDGYVTYEHESILLFKKRGKARRPGKDVRAKSRLTKEQRSAWFRGIWELAPARQTIHPAAFPVDVPDRLIRMFTFYGERVLDPFVGSGTTLLAATEAGRIGVGIELDERMESVCAARMLGHSLCTIFVGRRQAHAEAECGHGVRCGSPIPATIAPT